MTDLSHKRPEQLTLFSGETVDPLGPCDWCGQPATVSWSRTNNGWRTTIYACGRHSHEQKS